MTAQRLPFSKLEGLANDFVLIDARDRSLTLSGEDIRRLSDRRRGIGFDQILLLEPASNPDHHCTVTIFNSDGSAAEQCGNGMRAVGLWLYQAGELALADPVALQTAGGRVQVRVHDSERIEAVLAAPDFRPAAWGGENAETDWHEMIDGKRRRILGIATGNPHIVIKLDRPANAAILETVGPRLSRHDDLTRGANVNLAFVESRNRIRLVVHERGAGPTLACGSGACATAVALIHAGQADTPVTVAQPGGELVIHWQGESHPVSMTGPAHRVFDGFIDFPSKHTTSEANEHKRQDT